MDIHQRQMLRVATAIHEQLTEPRATSGGGELPHSAWAFCGDSLRRMRLARQHGWTQAAARQRQYLANHLVCLQGELASLVNALEVPRQSATSSSVTEIYRDICSLSREFDKVVWDLRCKTLSIHTEPISLEGIYLGPFEIQLDIRGMPDSDCYRVIALDPQPAVSNEEVIHPHVQDEQLCEGVGKMAIRRALRDGRIADFFLIVTNLLRTYNGGSPYVALADWNGTRCEDCGDLANEDDRCVCERCGNDLCTDCSRACRDCDGYFCSTCLSECSDCGEDSCRSCLKRCRVCNGRFCQRCLGNELCGNCRQQQEEGQDETEAETDDASQPRTVLAV